MVPRKCTFSLVVTIALLINACSAPQQKPLESPTQRASVQGNFVAQTTIIPTTLKPPNTASPSAIPTETLLPTSTATAEPTSTTVSTDIPESSTATCSNRAEFVRHLSFSDGSIINQGIYFSKAWRIKNIGTCPWTNSYSLVFVSGEPMKNPSEVPLTSEITPGATLDVQVTLFSPMIEGDYSSNWMLKDPSGNLFGFGDLADQPFSANILVQVKPKVDKFPAPECG